MCVHSIPFELKGGRGRCPGFPLQESFQDLRTRRFWLFPFIPPSFRSARCIFSVADNSSALGLSLLLLASFFDLEHGGVDS